MMVEFDEKRTVNFITEKEGKIKLTALPIEEDKEEILEAYPTEREAHFVLVSSSQGHSSDENQIAGSAEGDASSGSLEEEGNKKSRKITDTVEALTETGNNPEKSSPKRQKANEEHRDLRFLQPLEGDKNANTKEEADIQDDELDF